MATPEAKVVLRSADEKMRKAAHVTHDDLNRLRTGRASPAFVESLMIDAYGTSTPLNQLASINVPEPRLLVIQPYDKSTIGVIEKAIMASDLGVTPSNDGTIIRLPFPQLTEERRKEFVKVAHQRAEDGRVAVRNVRRHAKEELERMKKDGTISEDELRRAERELQQETDRHTAEIDELLAHKEKELQEV
ncbi:MAG: ribosome recycling factor [Actinomycetota bacterium]